MGGKKISILCVWKENSGNKHMLINTFIYACKMYTCINKYVFLSVEKFVFSVSENMFFIFRQFFFLRVL